MGSHTIPKMHGRIWRTPHVVIEQVVVPAPSRLRAHAHPVPQFSFLEEGRVTSRGLGGVRELERGALRSSPAGDEVDLSFEVPARCLVILLHDDPCQVSPRLSRERRFVRSERVETLARQLSARLGPALPIPFAGRSALPSAAREACRPQVSPSAIEIEALVLELAAEVYLTGESVRSVTPQPWLKRIRDRLRDDPLTQPTTVELACDTGYHPVYIARAFRRFYGIGLGDYARLVRAEYAHRLLSTTDLPLSEIALAAGYTDQSHFSRAIRRLFDSTPSSLRRREGCTVEVASIQDSRARDR